MSAPCILVVDDEADLRELLELTLIKMGLDVDCAEGLTVARKRLSQKDYSLVLTDMRLPDGSGVELVNEVATQYKNTPIAVITAYGSTDTAVAALKAGAFDYVSKPVELEQLRQMVRSALRVSRTDETGGVMPQKAPVTKKSSSLIGASCSLEDVRAQIARLARSMAPVSIGGESGTGKELVAREIHAQSVRADKPFIAVNCGAIPESLMEAEFFGYRKGAFTGANEDRNGFFQAANGGTLFLDEVADLPLAMQVKLLRVIQERRVRKVGATAEEPIDVRILSATHKNLTECIEKGSFRQDLYYRLNVIELALPPLRERLDDLDMLVSAILSKLCAQGQQARVDADAMQALRAYNYPGNIRELENILERALTFSNDGVIHAADLALKAPLRGAAIEFAEAEQFKAAHTLAYAAPGVPHASKAHAGLDYLISVLAEGDVPASLPQFLNEVEKQIIQRALEKTRFNRTQAAQLLGISFRQLRYQMQKLEIHEPQI